MARAISLIELLLAVGLISLVTLSGGALYTAASGFFSSFNVQAEVQNQANIALQHMVKYLSAADDVNVSDPPSTITFSEITPGGYTETYEYTLDDTCLCVKYGPAGDAQEIIARGVSGLIFSGPEENERTKRRVLTIELTMQGRQSSGLQPVRFITKVTLRRYE
ncbi:MAG: hypothetical protein ABIH40_06160 [Candidatus Omnitrophota bacterium]